MEAAGLAVGCAAGPPGGGVRTLASGPVRGVHCRRPVQSIGYAGELHPEVCAAFGLPARTAAAEIDLDALDRGGARTGDIPAISGFPVAKEDVALIVDDDVPAAEVERALRAGAGPLAGVDLAVRRLHRPADR